MEEQSKVKQLEIELKSTKDIIASLKEMLRGSKQAGDLKDIAAQTDENSNFYQTNVARKDIEVQVNRSAFTLSEIKKEPQIAMPNRPSSNAEGPSKKRKLSNVQRKARVSQAIGDDVSVLDPELYEAFCSFRRVYKLIKPIFL